MIKTQILTEGGNGIGLGHLTRCISLYQAFEEGGIIPEFIINGDKAALSLLKDKAYKVFNWLNEKEKLFSLIQDTEIIIIDSYLADLDLYKKISHLVKVPVYIDDNKRLAYPRGIVINANIHAEKLNYPKRKDIIYLLGSRYAYLRKAFWDSSRSIIRKDMQTVMVTFGGYDSKGMMPKILKILTEKFPELTKKIIVGIGFDNLKYLEKLKDAHTEIIYHPKDKKIKQVMLESDIAITGGGQTLYELASVGLPAISIAIADNQINNATEWHRRGFAEYAGRYDDKDLIQKLLQKISLLRGFAERKRRSDIGKSLVSLNGASKIVKFLYKIKFRSQYV